MTATEQRNCPVVTFDYMQTKPAGTWFKTYDELRAQFPWYRNEFGPGFWTVCNYQGILQVLQNPEVFSSSVVVAYDPDPPYKWIPEMLDGNEHKQWRHQLGPLFSPMAVERLEGTVRARAIELIDAVAQRESCDFMADFAQRFPTTIFLELMGLPVDELDQFLQWEHDILHAGAGDEAGMQKQLAAMMAVMGRFNSVIAERRAHPRNDIVSKALTYQIDGEPVSDADLLSFCLLMFMAGLDTVSVTLGWIFLHLARKDDDRNRIVTDPTIIPTAVEEFLRAYAIVIPARKVMKDVELQGCPMKAGDMVNIPLNAATRDDAAFPNATTVDITRKPNNHIGFGAGPHRCLGSHLARRELKIALEEWHKRIPHYRVAAGAELLETGSQLGLESLPLEWEA
ncbi:cytochrome P450 [Mycobacterium branderi]|uniref:Cytochrome P450 n=1 Tax=Mycobacterium branderi TaxID=43348 RepID=A0ABN6BEN4_9MYCO|nr:cytochrome P450 [Mycobacterium branderi]BBZ14869.1 cytochrome P450 [Mycobacterium branderi]